MSAGDEAIALFSRQYNCAQAVLGACGPAEGLDLAVCTRIAAPFGGGIARSGETCGAVTAALMVLGLRYGGDTTRDPAAKAAMYARAREFMTRFKSRHASIACRELLGCDVSTPEGWQQAQDRKLHETVCPKFVRDAVEILAGL